MPDQPSDPIAAAVERVCEKFYGNPQTLINIYLDGRKEVVPVEPHAGWTCAKCNHTLLYHWLRALREQLAETERERDAITEVLNSLGIETIGDMLAGAITSVMEDRTARLREALETIKIKLGECRTDEGTGPCADFLAEGDECPFCVAAAALART